MNILDTIKVLLILQVADDLDDLLVHLRAYSGVGDYQIGDREG